MSNYTKDAEHLYDLEKPIRPMTCQYQPFKPVYDPEWWGYKVYMTGDEEWGGPTMAGVIPKEVDTESPQQLSFL